MGQRVETRGEGAGVVRLDEDRRVIVFEDFSGAADIGCQDCNFGSSRFEENSAKRLLSGRVHQHVDFGQ